MNNTFNIILLQLKIYTWNISDYIEIYLLSYYGIDTKVRP